MKITVLKNGPLLIQGDASLVDAIGHPIHNEFPTRFALCRCGASSHKPFCDGNHTTARFCDPPEGPEAPGRDDAGPAVALRPGSR
jgi:CDGSH-type Zn-finger protein